MRWSQSRYRFHEIKHWASANAGVVRELEDVVTTGEDKDSGEKTFMSKKKFKAVKTVWEFIDSLWNQLVITFMCRPYDYGMVVIMRALHQARFFSQVS